MPEICLVFAPLVYSGFGRYYPSLAVLSAFLRAKGFTVEQIDLNTEMAFHILEPAFLETRGRGYLLSGEAVVTVSAMPAVAARLLKKNRHLLFDERGRIDLSDPLGPGYLLQELAKPFHIDAPLDALFTPSQHLASQLEFYDRLYVALSVPERIPNDVLLVGISVAMGPQIAPSLVLAKRIRRQRPKIRIVLGGPALSLLATDELGRILDHCPYVDAVVRYDGEEPLAVLAQQVREGAFEPSIVPNTSCRGPTGITHTTLQPGPSLHSLPFAEYSPKLIARLADPELGIIQARGCYWGECAYCDFVELYGNSRAFRSRTADGVVKEIAHHWRTRGARRFSLITEAIPPGFALRFGKLIIESGLEIRWDSFAMVDRRFTREHFETMAMSGCDHLVIGLETMNDRVLGLVKKAATSEDNAIFLKEASDAGIRLHVNLIPDLPSTTFREAMESLRSLEALRSNIHSVAVFPFEATRSSEVGRAPQRYGLTVDNSILTKGQAEFASNHLPAFDPAMTEDERCRVIRAYRDFSTMYTREVPPGQSVALDKEPFESNHWFTLATEDFDLAVDADRAVIFNWRTRQGWTGPRGIRGLLKQLSGKPFDSGFFLWLVRNPDVGRVLWDDLSRMGVFKKEEGR